MQFEGLDLPAQATEDWVEETNARDNVLITVPLSIEEDETHLIAGAAILSDTAVTMLYDDLGAWGLFTEYQLKNEVNIYNDDLLSPSVSLQGEDAQAMNNLALQFGEKLKDIYRVGFVPYIRTDMGDKIKNARNKCDCNSISEHRVQVMPGISEIEGCRVYLCGECMTAHGIEYDRRPIRNERAFDANWVLEGETPDGFQEIGDDDSYLLYSTGTPAGKLEHAIGLMNVIGGGISESFSTYYPGNEEALVYVDNDTLAGYLTWANEADGRPSLQQLFTREGFRRQGIGSALIDTWVDNYCSHDVFYVEEPNEQARNLFKNLGYWSGDKQSEAVEHYLLRGVTNSLDSGVERGESLSRVRNRL